MYLFFSSLVRYIDLVYEVLWPVLHTLYLFSLYMWMYVSFTSIFIHMFIILVCNLLFLFHTRCLDEFCLKCFRNTGCQSLLATNSLLAKFFKRLCYDRFYCIQQVSMSWVIMTSLICSFACCGFVTDCQRGRLLGHMWFTS